MLGISHLTRLQIRYGQESRGRKVLWSSYAFFGAVLIVYAALVLVRTQGAYWTWMDGWGVDIFEVLVSFLCIARGIFSEKARSVSLTLGLSLMAWSVGDIFITLESIGGATPPNPSIADVFYLAFYPFAYVAVILLMRSEIKRLSPPSYLDGAVAGLGASALCAAFAFHSILHTAGGNTIGVAANLSYPIGDVLLLALVVAVTTLLQGRGMARWTLMALGFAMVVAGDTFNLFGSTAGDTRVGSALNAVAWPTAILFMSISVWIRPRAQVRFVAEKTSGFFMPLIASMVGLVVLVFAALEPTGKVAISLATATLVTAGIRFGWSAKGLRGLTEERHKQAVTDELTGLGNRRYLFNVFDSFFETRSRTPETTQTLAVLFVDLDHFKEINDSFGHSVGDELLRQLGPRLVTAVRNNDVVVRLGGDEFAVVLIDADVEEARKVAERLTAGIEEPFLLDVVRAKISASIGIAILETDAHDSAGLLKCADVAMFRAKTGHAAFAFYDESLDKENESALQFASELRSGLSDGQFKLHYQPQLDLRTGEISAFETLLRWNNPRVGMVPPLKFLPIAEEAGLMPALTSFVLDHALGQCALWHADGHHVAVSVNASASNLLDAGFTTLVRRLLDQHSVQAEFLVLEITETCIISDYEKARTVIEDLRDLGLIVSIDDFGAGYTSLAYLGDLAVGELKLDRMFVTGLASHERSRDRALIRSTIELAHALRLRVVAEGIEDGETLNLLSELHCDIAQGFYIGLPLPPAELDFESHPEVTRQQALVS